MLDFITKEPINKGWSCDKKYCVTTADGTKYLLRVTPYDKSSNRENMFRMQQEVAKLGIPMCKPVDFGKCDEGVYTLQTWIDGKDAEDVIPTLTDSEQYTFGLEAGRILKKIHSIPAPPDQPDWEIRFNKKMDRKIQMYNDCPIKFQGAEYIIDYIEANRHLLKNRPQTYQHGDYHIGNMMIENGKIVIIDFDRYDFGDPWEEFNRIVWCASAPLFASGIVNGYFDDNVPTDFWKLLALYISSNMLSSIPWAIPFGDGEIQTMLNQAKDVLDWYDNMQNPVPSWYFNEYCFQINNKKIAAFENISFSYLDKANFDSAANTLFNILADNMEKIAPTGNAREEDYKCWNEAVKEGLKRAERQIILIKDNENIIGYFQYYTNADTFLMEEIQIKAEYHGKNIFRNLYSFIIANIRNDLTFVEAYANIQNLKSIGILEHLGLSKVGMNKNGSSFHFKGNYSDLIKWHESNGI
ncbi:MAG: phosphotransferase [Clostridia bacterium]|nr:phosphotransferase [Clostridia bacterium]